MLSIMAVNRFPRIHMLHVNVWKAITLVRLEAC